MTEIFQGIAGYVSEYVLSIDNLWIWFVAAFAAGIVKGLCGFANTLVFDTILAFSTSNSNITPVETMLGTFSNTIYVIKERKSVDLKKCLPVAALVLIGSIPGMIFLKTADVSLVKIIFGFIIVGIGVEMLIRELGPKKIMKQNKIVLFCIGLLSGVVCGIYGIGALLSAYFSRVTENSHQFKANICVVFLIEHIFRIISYIILDIFVPSMFIHVALLLPFLLIGLFIGMRCCKYLNEKVIKRIVIITLMVSGIALVINSL